MRTFCTLFDSKYLTKGLVLYESLRRHSSEEFELIVLAMDEECAQTLAQLRLPHVEVFHLEGFEMVACADKQLITELRQAKAERTWQEYCWTLASQLALHVLNNRREVTYLDADLMFFSDPEVIFDEIGERSIAVIPHRLIPSKRHLEVNGKFNVSLVYFRNDETGRACLSRWAEQCRERCSAAIGCGDQCYLDSWPDLYGDKLCIIQNIGVGLAPWNLANYWIGVFGSATCIGTYPLPTGAAHPVVFYHYHEFEDGVRLTNYDLRPADIALIYEPYLESYQSAKFRIAEPRLDMAAADNHDLTSKL